MTKQGEKTETWKKAETFPPPSHKHKKAHKDTTSEEIMIFIMWIRIRMFLGLPDPDPLVRDTDPAPVLLLFSKNSKKKTWIPTVL
jgi:hypothetical protein